MTKVQCEYTVTREVAGLKLNRQQVWKQKQKQKKNSPHIAWQSVTGYMDT